MTTVRHVSQCCSLRYSFSFSHKCPGLVGSSSRLQSYIHISLRSLHRVQYVRLLLFYSVIFQSCKFSYPETQQFLKLEWGCQRTGSRFTYYTNTFFMPHCFHITYPSKMKFTFCAHYIYAYTE